ncbi:MAG: YqaE/Pmp3 family membrane protein [Chloroflexi bacterium]|nr:YqaE/Pmp3 family membrane protein [Chloroflexota bacterium]
MLYVLAIFLPPVAVLICGKPFQALLNVGLCLLLWVPGVIHAWVVVSNYYADKRNNRVVKAINQQTDAIRRSS